jgi:Spy/CpxP family protein refolding chaperone
MKLLHAFALAATVALGANTAHAAAASPVDPPVPTLIEPGQTHPPRSTLPGERR